MNKNHLVKNFNRGGGQSVESSTTRSHLPTHSQTPSHKSHFFKPLIASSLALALGVSVASAADCSIGADGKPTADCTVASADNSGMFVGVDGTQLTDVDTTNLTGFQWAVDDTILKPTSDGTIPHTQLNFSFSSSSNDDNVTGSGSGAYTITIGAQNNKAFLLNAGDKTLNSNLTFSLADKKSYYLNAGGIEGALTLDNQGSFTAHLTGGITGNISNNGRGADATLNFTSPTGAKAPKEIALGGSITTANGAITNLNFSNVQATIAGAISGDGTKSIKLDSTNGATALTLNSATNAINTFFALGNQNTLTIGEKATIANTISTLNLGKDQGTATGSLTIINNSGNALTITDFNSQDANNVLTIAKGNVEITNAVTGNSKANFTLDSSAGATGLTLKDTASAGNTIAKLTALSGDNQEMNTLTIAKEANKTNTITELALGNGSVKGLLTIANSGGALGITTLTANADSALTLSGAYGAIDTLTLGNGANLTLDAKDVNSSSGNALTIATFTGSENGTLTIAKGNVGITGALAGENNNFTLNGTDTDKVNLTLKGTANNAINTFTALGDAKVTDNTLTIDAQATGTNTIGNLVLGAAAVDGGPAATNGFLTIANSGGALGITTLTANADSALTLSGAYGAIDTLTLGNGANLTLDASAATDSTSQNNLLVVNTFTGAGGKLTISKGAVEIKTLKKTETSENNIALGDNTTLTLNGGILNNLETAGTHTITFASGNTTIEGAITAVTKNDFKLTGKDSGTSATFNNGISGTTNNFTLDSSAGATNLTLGGAGNKTLTSLTALGGSATAPTNTLTIAEGASGANKIEKLNLGENSSGTTTGFLTINNSSGKVLEITNFASQEAGNILTIDKGAVGITGALAGDKNNIALSNATLTLTGGGNLNKLETTAEGTNTIHLNGNTEIAEQITAKSGVTNNFHIGENANPKITLKLTVGFNTDGGKNSFTIYENGTLDLGTTLNNGLTTEMGTTEFIIKEGATFELLKDIAITATNKGTNIIESSGTIALGAIKANGKDSKNEITINDGTLTLNDTVTSDGGENSFIIGDGGTGRATLTLDASKVITTTNLGTTSFTIKKGSTLTLTGTPTTLTANNANNKFIIENGATVTINSGSGFYNAIEATNKGTNIIDTAVGFNLGAITADGSDSKNEIILRGVAGGTATTMEVAGEITANGTGENKGKNNFTLDSSAKTGDTTKLTLSGADAKTITNLTALSFDDQAMNTLTIENGVTSTTINELVLGAAAVGESNAKTGFLTINNQAGNVLNIGTFKGEAEGSTLTISAGEVAITGELKGDHNNIALGDGSELTLNGGNLNSLSTAKGTTGTHTITFASGTTTITSTNGITAGASVINEISLGNNAILNSAITADGKNAINNITLTGTKGTINGVISGTSGGENNIKLDSNTNASTTTTLTLGSGGGSVKNITKLTALSASAQAMNTLTITNGAGASSIGTLNLGLSSGGTNEGFLTITNNSGNALTITDLVSAEANNVLTINKGAVNIENALGSTPKANFKLDSNVENATTELTLGGAGDNAINILTALGGTSEKHNKLTIDAAANGKNIIESLVLVESSKSGVLTIANNAENGNGNKITLTISNLTSNAGSKLIIGVNSDVTIANQLPFGSNNHNIALEAGANLTLNGGSFALDAASTTVDRNINFASGETTITRVNNPLGENIFTLTGGTPTTTSAIFNGAISGTNNFTLDSATNASAKTQLTLNGKGSNTITKLTALSANNAMNTLTIDKGANGTNTIGNLVLGDDTLSQEKVGLLTIDNQATDDEGKPVALTINKFEGKHTGSTLTISAGEVNMGELVGEENNNNNIALKGATLTLTKGGNLNSLTTADQGTTNTINFQANTTTVIGTNGITAGAGVKNNIILSGGATLASDITANGGTNNIAIQDTSATIAGNLIQTGGTNNISFVADSQPESQTLRLRGDKNEVTTLTLGGKNNIINLAGDIKNNQVLSGRTDFRLLTIGNKTAGTGKLIDSKDTTLTFESYINLDATQSADLSKNAKLGGENASDAQNQYGYAYSDRVIIHNVGNNQDQAQGTYKFKAYYSRAISENDLGADKYTEGGTETQGNIALFTIAKLSDNQGVINLATSGDNQSQAQSTTRVGVDAVTTTLTRVETDKNGKTTGNKDYFTYFVSEIKGNKGGDGNGTGGEGDNSQVGHIIRDSNLMIQSMAVSAVNLYLANFNSLNKRMGELRDNAYSKGVWARTFIGSQSNNLGLSDRTGYFSLQAGFDGTIKTEKANNFIGVAISYSKNFGYSSSKNNARDLNNGVRTPELGIDSLNAQLVELALYNSYVSNEGWYNDTIGKFSYIQNSMSVKDQRGANVGGINGAVGEFNTFALTLSNEVGYRAKLGEDKAWFIDPQAELAIGHINGVNFSLNHYNINQANATISSAINLRARAGASIGYDFKNFTQDKGIDAKVYVGAFYEMDYFHYTDGSQGIKYTTKLKDTREVKMLDTDHRAVLNVGTNLTIKDATRIYLDFEKSFGGKITTDYKINAGVRYSFGEALSEKGKEVLKDKESVESEAKAPLKLEEKDKQAKVEEKSEQDKAQG